MIIYSPSYIIILMILLNYFDRDFHDQLRSCYTEYQQMSDTSMQALAEHPTQPQESSDHEPAWLSALDAPISEADLCDALSRLKNNTRGGDG